MAILLGEKRGRLAIAHDDLTSLLPSTVILRSG
jgi:hypothetical protein